MSSSSSRQEVELNKERIFDYVKKFSFPRLAGTEGEEKAVELTVKTFKQIGYKDEQIETQSFTFSDFYSTTLIKFIMLMSFNFILILRLLIYLYLLFTIVLIASMSIVVFLIIRGLRYPEKNGFWGIYFGDEISATNVFAKLPAKRLPEKDAGDIVISAHLDTKSQTFKTSWRIVAYRVWLFSGIIMGGFYFAILINVFLIDLNLNFMIADYALWVLTILIVFSNVMLLFLNTHNKSPGALDNASGMAIVFELSDYFKDKPLDNFNIWFCQFSAEELGTMGSRFFVNKYEDKFEKGRIFQINFDMVSGVGLGKGNRVEYLKSYGIFPRKKIAPLLSRYMDKAAEEEEVNMYGFHLSTGAHLDSVPFHLRGFSALDIATRGAARYTHNKVDTPDKVDPQVLKEAAQIARTTMINLDNDYKTLCASNELICEEE